MIADHQHAGLPRAVDPLDRIKEFPVGAPDGVEARIHLDPLLDGCGENMDAGAPDRE